MTEANVTMREKRMTSEVPAEWADVQLEEGANEHRSSGVLRGALAGTVATLPMSLFMLGAQKAGLMGKQPPEHITESFLDRIGIRKRPDEAEDVLAALNHFVFGAVGGAIYGLVRRERVPEVPQGMAFGLAMWAASYKGWVPAAGIMPDPDHDRPGRPTAMIAAHLLFGGALAGFYQALQRR